MRRAGTADSSGRSSLIDWTVGDCHGKVTRWSPGRRTAGVQVSVCPAPVGLVVWYFSILEVVLVADLRLLWGDLAALSSSLDGVRAGLDGVDVSGASVAASAMPGSVSSGRVEAAVSSLEDARIALGGCYGSVGDGVRALVGAHQVNDQGVSIGAQALVSIGPSLGRGGRAASLAGLE